MTAQEQAAALRRGAGCFLLGGRGLVRVRGSDRARWLDGMLTNDVAGLSAGPERSGCYALLLTRQGRIVADLHVLWRPDQLWLELAADAEARVIEALGRFIVADDVALEAAGGGFDRVGVEGPGAPGVLEAATGAALPLAPDACAEAEVAGARCLVAAFGWSGAPGRQLFVAAGRGPAVAEALLAAGAAPAGAEALEILRIEAGIPRLGAELGEDVLPPEAHLERAISRTKGCYTGQEIVARLASRGQVKHQLVGLRLQGGEPPARGAAVLGDGRRIGEVTSACRSPAAGVIALGFVRLPHDVPGTSVTVEDRPALVSALPFLPSLSAPCP